MQNQVSSGNSFSIRALGISTRLGRGASVKFSPWGERERLVVPRVQVLMGFGRTIEWLCQTKIKTFYFFGRILSNSKTHIVGNKITKRESCFSWGLC